MAIFTGVSVALVTLRNSVDEPDIDATAVLAGDLADRGMQAILACGTTGEASRLSDDQRCAVIKAVRAVVPASVPVIAGTGATSTQRAGELTEAAVGAGADVVLAWPPSGSSDLLGYFTAVRDAAAGVPVLAYHVPWVSEPGVPVDSLAGLPVVGIKDSSGDPDRLLAEIAHYSGSTYVGSAAILALAGPLGAAGAILAAANLEPETCVEAFDGSAAAQRELTDLHLALRAGGPPKIRELLAAQARAASLQCLGG